MVNHYLFNEKENKCFIKETGKELELISKNSFQWKYKHNDSNLLIEKLGPRIFAATLKNVLKNTDTITNYSDKDFGRAVYDKEKGDYVLKYGLPKIFYLFKNDYQDQKESWTFNFNHDWHLILKDKDENKPYYWYQWDYSPDLATFIYETLSPHIKPEKGEIVAIPGELGEACAEWSNNNYIVNYFYCGYDEENEGYNFYHETAGNWKKNNGETALIITFLPTYFKNYELERGEKLTGTTWLKKVWEVWGKRGVPIVVKCYRGFVFTHLYRYHQQLYEQISSITELPTSINNREVGKSNLLIYFNMPFLSKKTPYIV